MALNAVALRSTRYANAAVTRFRADGREVASEDVPGCPARDMHVNVPGRYAFTAPPAHRLGPLRDPAESGEEE